MTDDESAARMPRVLVLLFSLIIALIGWDLIEDHGEGAPWSHLGFELVILLLAASGVLWQTWVIHRERTQLSRLEAEVARARREAQRTRESNRELLQGLGAAIARQFREWQLSPAEAEVGLLLLKGLSLKELATVRQTSERTVREQARAVYRKAKLEGRAALAAFFLEDLLMATEGHAHQQTRPSS